MGIGPHEAGSEPGGGSGSRLPLASNTCDVTRRATAVPGGGDTDTHTVPSASNPPVCTGWSPSTSERTSPERTSMSTTPYGGRKSAGGGVAEVAVGLAVIAATGVAVLVPAGAGTGSSSSEQETNAETARTIATEAASISGRCICATGYVRNVLGAVTSRWSLEVV